MENVLFKTLPYNFQDIQQAIAAKEPVIKSYNDTGAKLMKLVSDNEKPKVDEALTEVNEKWEALRVNVDELAKKLFSAQEQVQKFQLRLDELKNWLTQKEDQLASLEPVGVEPEKVKEQLAEQTVSIDWENPGSIRASYCQKPCIGNKGRGKKFPPFILALPSHTCLQ